MEPISEIRLLFLICMSVYFTLDGLEFLYDKNKLKSKDLESKKFFKVKNKNNLRLFNAYWGLFLGEIIRIFIIIDISKEIFLLDIIGIIIFIALYFFGRFLFANLKLK
ncbi:hypothetical protein WG909_07835 [Peptostreptococcaceae bacterium AGR-M142]